MIPLPFLFMSVFTFPAFIIAIVGGAATGFFLGSIFPPNPLMRRHRTFVTFGIMGFCGFVFFLGQTVEVALGQDSELAPRLLARGLLWLAFAGALTLVGVWRQEQRWRKKP